MKKSENINKNAFLFTCVACIILLLIMCYFGISNSLKGTSALIGETTYPAEKCSALESTYVRAEKECEKGVLTEGVCCPEGFSYMSSSCRKYYYTDSVSGKSDCDKNGGTFNSFGSTMYCALGSSKPVDYCTDGTPRSSKGNCCPSGKYYDSSTKRCVDSAYGFKWSTDDGQYVCFIASSGGENDEKSCYCMDTEDGTTCKEFSTYPGGGYTLSDSSACSSSSTTTCPAGQYYKGQGKCETCIAGYYCEGGTFSNGDSSRDGIKQCPSGTDSLAGAKSSSDCKTKVCFSCSQNSSLTCNAIDPSKCPSTCLGQWQLGGGACSSGSSSGGSSTKPVFTATFKVDSSLVRAEQCKWDDEGDGCEVKAPSYSCPSGSFKGWFTNPSLCSTNASGTAAGSILTLTENRTYWGCCSSGSSGGSGSGSTSNPDSGSSSKPSGGSSEPSSSYSNPDSSSSNSDNNVVDNPQTGNIAIFAIWIIALGAIVYSVWYFRKVKES